MLVKVSRKYCGSLGVFNEATGSVKLKDNTSAPFEMDDALAKVHIENGILVEASDDEEEDETPVITEDAEAPEAFEEDPADEEEPADEIPEEVPSGIPDELPTEGDDLEKITDYKLLKKMAKEAGINPVGKNKEELRAAIRESRQS